MKQMKKFAALLLALAMVFALAACGGEPTPAATPTPPAPTEHVHTEEVIPGVDATCTEDGLTEGVRCSECRRNPCRAGGHTRAWPHHQHRHLREVRHGFWYVGS